MGSGAIRALLDARQCRVYMAVLDPKILFVDATGQPSGPATLARHGTSLLPVILLDSLFPAIADAPTLRYPRAQRTRCSLPQRLRLSLGTRPQLDDRLSALGPSSAPGRAPADAD